MGSPVPLAMDLLVTLIVAVYFLNQFGSLRKNSFAVTLMVLLTWYFSLAVILVLPLDVSWTFYWDCLGKWYCSAYHLNGTVGCDNDGALANVTIIDLCREAGSACNCQPPWSYVDPHTLPNFWRVVFWSAQLLTWIILPMMQTYKQAGDFTAFQRFMTAFKANFYFYLSFGVVFGILLLVLAIKASLNSGDLILIAMGAANAWGMFFVIIMMGYGVVDVPRGLWRRILRHQSLSRAQFHVASIHNELIEAQNKLHEAQAEARSAAGLIPASSSLKKYVDTILLKCASDTTAAGAYTDYQAPETEIIWTRGKLASLHGKIIQLQLVVHRCEILLEQSIRKAVMLEEIIKQSDKADHTFIEPFGAPGKGFLAAHRPILLWWWYVRIKPICFLVGAILTTMLSMMVVFSEVLMFQSKPTLSVFAVLLNSVGTSTQYFQVEVITFFTLLYLAVCTYRVVLKLRIFNFYYLAPHQLTDEASLLFSGMLLSRLTIPMCLNFLSMSHLDTHVTEGNQIHQPTAFTQIMGHVDAISFYKAFMYHYPICMLPVAAMTLFNVGGRLMALCGFSSFLQEDDTTSDMVTEGKSIIRKERRMWQLGDGAQRPTRRVRTFQAQPATATIDDSEDDDRDLANRLRKSLNASPEPGGSNGVNGTGAKSAGRLSKSVTDFRPSGRLASGRNGAALITGGAGTSGSDNLGGRFMRMLGMRAAAEPLLDEDAESLLPSPRSSRPPSRPSNNGVRSFTGPPRNIFDDM